ncbi:cilia- and flagella-associated protein 57-like [Ruditapes philippinarum]|uniref:cilia- and flagella-associated protein 57-like n=1 Tax=Ruditapes philippinarum TaxID=129788 RepID=UPI00295A7DC3|nr:cilia- and flagella-associated protein 57-like [Ruditapes philippinarum]
MSIAIAQARHIFGLKSGVCGNICYHDEQTIVYPSGANCILYNIDQKVQKFIQGTDKSEGMTALAVSPNRRYVAIAEKLEKPTITIYDLHSLRKRKVLSSPDVASNEYVSLAFSPDSKYLVAQGGKPDYTLLYWTWEKSKVMAVTKTSNPQTNPPIYQVSFNPQDNTQLCVVGNGIFKNFRYSEGNLKTFNIQKVEPQNYLCHAWVSEERVIVGTDTGRLMLFEAGEMKHEFNIAAQEKKPGEEDIATGPPQITAIVSYSKGFACACGPGTVHLFEKTDDKDFFKKAREIKIPQDSNSADPSKSQHNLELYREFAEEAYSIALHPSGLYILVGFSDKLRLMNLLIDDIRTFKEFTIRGCRECAFSNGGNLFAAVHGNVIQIYSTITFDNVANLKGHNGKVRSIVWSSDDSKIVSCGLDGAVYEWETFTGKRVGESVLKSCHYTGVAVTSDGKTTFAVGSDKTLKEISDSAILREVDAGEATLTNVALSRSGRMLFAGTSRGTLWSLKFPLTIPGEWQELQGHGSTISKMKITYDDQFLVTVSEDSSIILWKIQDKEGRGVKRDKEVGWAEEILITKSDLEEKNSMMAELKTRVDELKMENGYQLRLKDMNYNEKIKELTEKFIQEMESLKTKNQVLKTDKDKEEAKHEEEMAELMEKHSKKMIFCKKSANNQKLMLEYEKFQEQQAKMMKMQEDYDRQLVEMEESKQRALEELTEYYETKIQEMTTKLEQSNDETRQQTREYEETKKQIEEDADREILDIKNKYERRLRDEKEANMRLKGETGIMKKKFTSLQKEIDDHKEEIKKYQADKAKLENIIRNLEKDILGLKKEIQERDDTIKIRDGSLVIDKLNTALELNITELRQKLKATDKEMHQERQRVRDKEAVVKRFKTDLHNCVGYIQDPKMLKESIKALYQKHVQEDITESASVDADIQKEYSRQREHLERSVASLRKKLAKDSEIHRADNVRIMQENVSLIKEINDLRKELKIARTMIHDLEATVKQYSKRTGGEDGDIYAVMLKAPNALVENELEEKNKIIDMQKFEIRKLRMEMETGSRPGSSTKLPPMQAVESSA